MKYPEYEGLSYTAASREGFLLVREATKTGHWLVIVDKLVELRRIMNVHFDHAL